MWVLSFAYRLKPLALGQNKNCANPCVDDQRMENDFR